MSNAYEDVLAALDVVAAVKAAVAKGHTLHDAIQAMETIFGMSAYGGERDRMALCPRLAKAFGWPAVAEAIGYTPLPTDDSYDVAGRLIHLGAKARDIARVLREHCNVCALEARHELEERAKAGWTLGNIDAAMKAAYGDDA